MRTSFLLLALFVVALAWLPLAGAGEDPPAPTLSDLTWLEGHWRSGGDNAFDEVWLPAGGGTLAAVSRLVHGGKTNLYELSAIEPTEKGLVLRIRHFGPGLAPWNTEEAATPSWPLAKQGKDEVAFEDPAREFPRRIAYRRERPEGGPDVLVARLEGTAGGKPKEMEFRLTRAGP